MKNPSLLYFAALLGLLASCETLPISERRQISHPCMLFDGTGASGYECGVTTQLESGRAGSAGAAGAGCASCH